jgi:hypothetical protein
MAPPAATPPGLAALTVFPLKVLLFTVSVPLLEMPPPAAEGPDPAKFPVIALLESVRYPELRMPPPLALPPLRIVRLARVTWALVPIEITLMCPPSMMVVLALEPISVKLELMVRFSL